jgi:hypothetical protein
MGVLSTVLDADFLFTDDFLCSKLLMLLLLFLDLAVLLSLLLKICLLEPFWHGPSDG